MLTELENRGLTFVADIAIDTKVYVQELIVGIPEKKGKRGYKEVYFKAIKVWRRQDDSPCENPLWFLISKDAKSGEIKHSFCNASENASFEELAKMQSSRYWLREHFRMQKDIVKWLNTW